MRNFLLILHTLPLPTIPDLVPSVPAKRGRKPGPLSRSAREAQRRLNHSIIEKARRTKINDTLATLRQLEPVDYGSETESREDAEDNDDDDEYPEIALQLFVHDAMRPQPSATLHVSALFLNTIQYVIRNILVVVPEEPTPFDL